MVHNTQLPLFGSVIHGETETMQTPVSEVSPQQAEAVKNPPKTNGVIQVPDGSRYVYTLCIQYIYIYIWLVVDLPL